MFITLDNFFTSQVDPEMEILEEPEIMEKENEVVRSGTPVCGTLNSLVPT